MKKVTKTAGVILFCTGFFAMFGEASTAGSQILWSLGAAAVCCIGAELINMSLKKEGRA